MAARRKSKKTRKPAHISQKKLLKSAEILSIKGVGRFRRIKRKSR